MRTYAYTMNRSNYSAALLASSLTSLPQALPTSSLLVCANDTTLNWSPASFTPLSLREGGSLFDLDDRIVFNAKSEGRWEASNFVFQGRGRGRASNQLEGLEFGGLAGVLASDPFFAGSFVNQRCVTMVQLALFTPISL